MELVAIGLALLARSGVEAGAVLSAERIPLGSSLTCTVTVTVESQGRYRFREPAAPRATRFEAAGTSLSIEATVVDGRAVGTRRYRTVLRPLSAGRDAIRPAPVAFLDTATGTSDSIAFGALEVEVTPRPRRWGLAVLAVLAAVALAGGLVATAVITARVLRRRRAAREKRPEAPSPSEMLRAEIERARGDLRLGNRREAYERVCRAAAACIDGCSGGAAPGTSPGLEENPVVLEVRRLLDRSDEVRYGGVEPEEEETESFARAVLRMVESRNEPRA